MALKVAQRGSVPPFIVMDVMQAAADREAAGMDVVHLEVGQPGTPAPEPVRAAAARALADDRLGYTLALGIDPLRQRIARYYGERYDIDLDMRRIVITNGASGAFMLAFLSAFAPGDAVMLPLPSYPAYRHIMTSLGLVLAPIATTADTRFQPTAGMVEDAARAQPVEGLIVTSPSNPTGTMLADQTFAEIASLCAERGIRLVSDEIYHGITYGPPARTALSLDDRCIVINSFSKYFSMTGWRLGWMVVPEDMVRPIECLAQNLFISPPTLPQLAAVAAFDHTDLLDDLVANYARNRALLLEGLPRAGFDRLAPADGAFYIYADISARTDDARAFCARMLDETGVATAPGIDFDPDRGHKFMRMSFAGPTADIEAAIDRLQRWRT